MFTSSLLLVPDSEIGLQSQSLHRSPFFSRRTWEVAEEPSSRLLWCRACPREMAKQVEKVEGIFFPYTSSLVSKLSKNLNSEKG